MDRTPPFVAKQAQMQLKFAEKPECRQPELDLSSRRSPQHKKTPCQVTGAGSSTGEFLGISS